MIQTERLIRTFTELVAIDSPTYREEAAADYLRQYLSGLGIACAQDDAGSHIHGTTGNLFARVPGTLAGEPLLFCTHMDTVEPSCGKRAVRYPDGRITTAGDTVLGADDFAGVAAVLEVLTALKESGTPHLPLELIFSAAEEHYCTGIRYFDFSKCKAKTGFVLDLTGPVGTAALAAPTTLSFPIRLHGLASHAGFAPEAGINTIAAAAKAMGKLQQGYLDADTTLNFGVISGGKAPNIVADLCTIRGEIRSMRHERAIEVYQQVQTVFCREAAAIGARMEYAHDIPIQAYRVREDSGALRRFEAACRAASIPMQTTETFGGSDNAAMQKNGIDGIVVANAMYNCHSTTEYTTVQDLCKTAELVWHLVTDRK